MDDHLWGEASSAASASFGVLLTPVRRKLGRAAIRTAMHSAKQQSAGLARPTLARWLAWTLIAVAATAAIVTSVAAMVVADILMVGQARRSAQDASGVLAVELDETQP